MGLNLSDVARSVTAATSSSRYTQKNLWLDDRTSYTYQVQVQVPEYNVMHEVGDLKEIPLVEGQARPVLERHRRIFDRQRSRGIRPCGTEALCDG